MIGGDGGAGMNIHYQAAEKTEKAEDNNAVSVCCANNNIKS